MATKRKSKRTGPGPVPPRNLLGPLTDREKTDIRVPREFGDQVEQLCKLLGVPKNAFFVMAAAQYSVTLFQLHLKRKTREEMYDLVESLFMGILREARSFDDEDRP